MSQPELYICYSVNGFFAREAGISLLSFLENNPGYEPEEVFFVDYGILPANRAKLDSIAARYGKRITYLNGRPVTSEVLPPLLHSHIGVAMSVASPLKASLQMMSMVLPSL